MSVAPTESDNDETGVLVVCHKCGYEWDYSRNKWMATCPNCNSKTKTPFHEDCDDPDETTAD